MKEPYFFLSKNLKELKIIIENIIFENNGCGIIYGDRKTGKTAFVKYLETVNSKKRNFFYVQAEEIDFKEIFNLKNYVIVIDDVHKLTKDQINSLKDLCEENFVIFVIDKEYLVLLKEYLKDKNVKFSLEIKPVSLREVESLFEQYIKSVDKPIQKNKEIIKYLYELTGGKLGDIFENLEKLNDLVYYFTLKVSYKQKIKYLTFFLIAFFITTVLLTAIIYITKNQSSTKPKHQEPVIEKSKREIKVNQPVFIKKQENKTENKEKPNIKDNNTSSKKENSAIVIGQIVNLREAPSINSNIVSKLKKLQIVQVLDETDEWAKVKVQNLTGWIKKDYIKTIPEGYAVVRAYFLNLRTKPTNQSEILAKLKAGDVVQILDEEKGKWVKVKYKLDNKEIEGWVSEVYLFKGKTAQ